MEIIFFKGRKKTCLFHEPHSIYVLRTSEIFLKEVINHNVQEPLLCSHFLKTTLFWLIQIGNIKWCPDNLLHSFWTCFKYLIHCVWFGVLPNFFIAQNNMFINKVVGYRQRCLFEQLRRYYEMGCIIMKLRARIERNLMVNNFVKGPEVGHMISVVEKDKCLKREMHNMQFPTISLNLCYLYPKLTFHLSQVSLTEYQLLTLQVCIVDTLITTAYLSFGKLKSSKCKNRKFYKSDRLICRLLTLACKHGEMFNLLYLAIYYYATCRYKDSIKKNTNIKIKIFTALHLVSRR